MSESLGFIFLFAALVGAFALSQVVSVVMTFLHRRSLLVETVLTGSRMLLTLLVAILSAVKLSWFESGWDLLFTCAFAGLFVYNLADFQIGFWKLLYLLRDKVCPEAVVPTEDGTDE